MQAPKVIDSLSALAHEHRLAIYRLLVQRGPEGLSAGAVGERIGLLPSSLTFHLHNLRRAGLVTQQRVGRQLIYAADFDAMNGLIGYLTENCCTAGSAQCGGGGSPLRTVKASRRPAKIA
jgi:DNA-binding transcriptional ArsR family regulator